MYGYEPVITKLGKPFSPAYDFGKRIVDRQAKEFGVSEITQYFMIGDNTRSDIEGANRMQRQHLIEQGKDPDQTKISNPLDKKWVTILVRTGVFKEGESTNNADYVVDDLKAAYEIILKSFKVKEEEEKKILQYQEDDLV